MEDDTRTLYEVGFRAYEDEVEIVRVLKVRG
jgi:hypothetical protein